MVLRPRLLPVATPKAFSRLLHARPLLPVPSSEKHYGQGALCSVSSPPFTNTLHTHSGQAQDTQPCPQGAHSLLGATDSK